MKTDLPSDDYVLTEGSGWFDVKGFLVHINSGVEGVAVDIYDRAIFDAGLAPNAIASTSAHVSDLEVVS